MTQPLPCSCPCLSLPYSSPKLQLYACHDSTIALLMSMSLSHTVHPSYSCTRATTQPLPCSCPGLSLSYGSPKLQLYACHESTIALLMSMSLSHTVHPSYSCTRAMTPPLPCSCPCLSPIQFTQVTAVRVPRLNHCPAHVHVSLPYSSPKLQLYACHDSTIALLMSMSLSHTVHPSYSCTRATTQPLPCSCPCLSLIQFTQVTAVRVPRLNHCPAHVHVSLSHTVHPSYSCTRATTQPLPCSCPCLSLPYSSPKLQLYACHDSTIALLMSMSLSLTVHPSYSCTRATTQPLPCSCPCLSLLQFTQVTAVRVPQLNHCPAHVHVSLSYSSPKLQLYACHDSTIALLMSMSLSHTVHPSYSCTRAMTQPLPCSCPCLSLIQFTQVTAVRVP